MFITATNDTILNTTAIVTNTHVRKFEGSTNGELWKLIVGLASSCGYSAGAPVVKLTWLVASLINFLFYFQHCTMPMLANHKCETTSEQLDQHQSPCLHD